MALTRNMLKGMELTDEQVSTIINEHVATVDALKEQLKEANGKVEKLTKDTELLGDIQEELNEYKSGDWQTKYEAEHTAFEAYKKDVNAKETTSKLQSAYRKLLREANVGEKHIDSIIKVTDFSNIKLDKEGNIVDSDKVSESITSEWSGFITSTKTEGATVANPPKNAGNIPTMTKEDIIAIKDGDERRKAIAEHPDLFRK